MCRTFALTLRQTQKEAHSQKSRPSRSLSIVDNAALQSRHNAPNNANQRQPNSWTDPLQDQVPHDFERNVANEEQRKSVQVVGTIGAQSKITLESFETCIRDVGSVEK